MEGHLLMSRKELERKSVLELVQAKRLTLVEASERMHLSYRQTLRVFARFSAQGDAGLVHRRRGQASNRAYPAAFRDKVLARYRERYKDVECGKELSPAQNDKFTTYMATHIQKKEHKCVFCAQVFTHLNPYRKHMAIHAEEKP